PLQQQFQGGRGPQRQGTDRHDGTYLRGAGPPPAGDVVKKRGRPAAVAGWGNRSAEGTGLRPGAGTRTADGDIALVGTVGRSGRPFAGIHRGWVTIDTG